MRPLAPVLALLCAGCVAIGPDAQDMQRIDTIVAESVAAAHEPPERRQNALVRAQQAFAANASDANRLQLAVLLATLPPPHRDDARAMALLEPLAAASPQTPLARFAALLAEHVAERQRAARAGERREEKLRRQVEVLKSIEREVFEREERARARRR